MKHERLGIRLGIVLGLVVLATACLLVSLGSPSLSAIVAVPVVLVVLVGGGNWLRDRDRAPGPARPGESEGP